MKHDDRLISDFTCALPASAWTDADSNLFKPIAKVPPQTWRIIDYKSRLFNGRMLQATSPAAPSLTIPLNARGWHAVSIGMTERSVGSCGIELRLTGMKHWQTIFAYDGEPHEEPWIFADLTGRDLEIRYPRDLSMFPSTPDDFCARIMSVRLRPVAPEHVPVVSTKRHRPLVYTNDGHGIFYMGEKPGAHLVEDALNRFADSDWSVCCFSNGGADLVNYPSNVGTRFGEDGWDWSRRGDGNLKAMLEGTLALGVDPMKVAIEKAHAQGQEFWMYIRPQAWIATPADDHAFRSRFFQAHPEWRCMEPDGTPDSKMSIAFEGVRRQLNAIAGEGLERGADGITLAFNRGYPMVRYEEPVRRRFEQRHGLDPVGLPDTDPRLQLMWAEFMTEWLRELRGLLDGFGPAPHGGGRRKLTVMTGSDSVWNGQFGYDVAAWARAKLVDVVISFPKSGDIKNGYVNTAEYVKLLAGTGVPHYASFGSNFDHRKTLAAIRKRAHERYQAGADGLARWDAYGYLARLDLDDPEIQRLWCEHYMGPQDNFMREVAGITLEYFGPGLAL